jgi:translation initiation factor 1
VSRRGDRGDRPAGRPPTGKTSGTRGSGGSARTVYSSQAGRICPHCGLPTSRCVCRANPRGAQTASAPEGDGIVRVGRSSKGRKGKTVTSVTGVPLPPDELRELAKDLKRVCGTGGTLKEGVVEIQGDHRDTLVRELEQRGFQVKRTGG